MRAVAGEMSGGTSPVGVGWRIALLYLRSRRFGHSLLAVAACLAVAWWLGDVPSPKEAGQELVLARDQALLIHALSAFLAGIIGVAVWSPFGEPERISPVVLPLLRLAHVLLLLAIALAGATALVAGWHEVAPGVEPGMLIARNTLCLLALALLGARALDARLAWIVPVTLAGVTFVAVLQRAEEMRAPGDVWTLPAWNLLGRPSADAPAMAVALIVGVIGLALYSRSGARDTGDEAE